MPFWQNCRGVQRGSQRRPREYSLDSNTLVELRECVGGDTSATLAMMVSSRWDCGSLGLLGGGRGVPPAWVR